MADMATHCFAGNVARGMTLVVLSNGGGVGIGRSVNGGNGIVLDGSDRMDEIVRKALSWDVMGGVARRAWARNSGAIDTCNIWNQTHSETGAITVPHAVDEAYIRNLVNEHNGGKE
jgi:urocanate hydratase